MSANLAFTALILVLGVLYDGCMACDYAQWPGHTMCKYAGMGKDCNNVLNRELTQDQINVVLDAHNKLRSKVATGNEPGQPSAADMKELTWDPELAKIAQRWTDQCVADHDANKGRSTQTYPAVGQNFAMAGSSEYDPQPDLTTHVNEWYKEVNKMKLEFVSSYQSQKEPNTIGHYTQVVWAKTEKVGCGFVHFKPQNSIFYFRHLFCNYGPSGNYPNQKVYEIGPAGSKCTNGRSAKYQGLCAP